MKKLIVLAICMAGVLAAQAQGTVQFANVGGGVNKPVINPDTGAAVGAGAQVLLFVGDTLPSALDPSAAVGTANILANGLFSGGGVTLPNVAAGSNVSLFIGVTGTGGADLVSTPFSNATGGVGSPPSTPAFLTGLNGAEWQVIPEPSTIALGILGAGLLLWRRRK
jgi:hypothetical protein